MEEIKNQIENTIYWIRIDKKKSVVLAKGNSKKETKEDLKEKIKDDEKLEGALIYRIIIKVHKKKVFDKAIMHFKFDNYSITKNKLKKIHLDNQEGALWFREDWLLKNGWSKKYISNAVNLLRKGKGKIVIPGISYYHLLGQN